MQDFFRAATAVAADAAADAASGISISDCPLASSPRYKWQEVCRQVVSASVVLTALRVVSE